MRCLIVVSIFNIFNQGCYCAQTIANLLRSSANAPSRGWGGSLGCNLKLSLDLQNIKNRYNIVWLLFLY